MKLGFITPTYAGEKRVALLPKHVNTYSNEIYIEHGFGETLDISDEQYQKKGCIITSKEKIFNICNAVFSLKGISEQDYYLLREKQIVIGFIQPTKQGKIFLETIGKEKSLYIVDLDSVNASVYHHDQVNRVPWIPSNYVYKNSVLAGYAAVMHATMMCGIVPNQDTKVAVLGTGNVSQGAFSAIGRFNSQARMFYRETIHEFKEQLKEFDIIINGIEMRDNDVYILTETELKRVKAGALIIDAAAIPNQVFEGTRQTKLNDPLYKKEGVYYYLVNNTHSLFYREASHILSEAFCKYVFIKNIEHYRGVKL